MLEATTKWHSSGKLPRKGSKIIVICDYPEYPHIETETIDFDATHPFAKYWRKHTAFWAYESDVLDEFTNPCP